MEKAIEIKRRAQRCIQNGDLAGALSEYEKLVASDDPDPYNFVLLADLLYKKGDHSAASQRYLAAVSAYEKAGLYKNAAAVCKKMIRLGLSPTVVLGRLAHLHSLDGLSNEACLSYMQHGEHLALEDKLDEAVEALEKAIAVCPETIKALEKLAEVHVLRGDQAAAARCLMDAAQRYDRARQPTDAERCRTRALHMRIGVPDPPRLGSDASLGPRDSTPSTADLDDEPPELAGFESANGAPMGEPGTRSFEDTATGGDPPRIAGLTATGSVMAPRHRDLDLDPVEPAAESMLDSPEEALAPPPGLDFESPATVSTGEGEAERLGQVESLLARAEEEFRAGDRENAGATLLEAARAYDEMDRRDSAAAIYRSLARSAQSPIEVLDHWLENCEAREDRREAAQVACALGDRALNLGDEERAVSWFERARQFDGRNDLALRRLQRLRPSGEVTPDSPTTLPSAPSTLEVGDDGRIEISMGRAEAVTLDLGSLIAEFQRGLEAQLSGDAQSHYDLAMSYFEMGLPDQAIEAFRTASQDPAFAPRCAEMIGRALLDQARFDDAVQEFTQALARPGIPADAALNLRFQLALAHEAAGRRKEALAEFERVYAAQANYPDVAVKIRSLRKTLENV